MSTDALRAYKTTRVNTASMGDLLLMLYDAAVRHGTAAVEALERGEKAQAHTHLLKAQEIVNELIVSLDFKVELSKYLYQLYEYCTHCFTQANLTKRPADAQPAVEILSGLREAWREAVKAEQRTKDQGAAAVTLSSNRDAYRRSGGIEFAG